MSNPIQVTESAIVHLKYLCEAESAKGFRLSVKAAGCSGYRYVPEMYQHAQAGDLTFSCDGLPIAVPEKDLQWLQHTTVDLKTGDLGQTQLIFRNPRAQNVCGCGESFNLNEDGDGADH